MAVVSVTEDQTIDLAGNLQDVFTVTFTIEGKPGSFTIQVPQGGDPVAAAAQAIAQMEGQVNGIYGL